MAKKVRRHRARGEGSCYSYRTEAGNLRWRVEPVGGGAGGKAGFLTRAEALAWLRANLGKPAAPGTVGEWLSKWLELHKPDWKTQTHRRAAFSVRRWLVPRLGAVRLRDLTGYQIASMLATMAREGVKDPERHKAGSHLKAALNSAVALGVLGSNPMTTGGRVKLPSPRHPEKRAFDPAQVRALVAAADLQGKGHVVRLWLDAGLRPGELLGLDWEDIDLGAGTVRVVRSWDSIHREMNEPKTPRSRRVIRLGAATVASLRAEICTRMNDTERHCTTPAGPLLRAPRSGRYWQSEFHRAWWSPLLEAAGLAGLGFGPYSVRHATATHLLRAGVPVLAVSRRLGHATPTMTLNCYAHLLDGDDAAAADVMGGLLG